MNISIRTRHTTLFDDFEPLAAEKLGRLERWLARPADAVVEVAKEETRAAAHRFTVQVTVHSGATILRAEERAGDPRIALEAAADVLARQARRHKARLKDRHQPMGGKQVAAEALAAPDSAIPGDGDDEDEYVAGKVVRVKHFEAKPMSTEEALAQMDLLGHDFFLYMDASSGDYSLLYRREDGDYGLLAPRRA
jgi:putative sigma-54 modulation protein